ncbi:MAG: hypothetical protein AAES65_15530 [Candidatus Thiodiazotropha sp. (ex. Lucinoma kazani)]
MVEVENQAFSIQSWLFPWLYFAIYVSGSFQAVGQCYVLAMETPGLSQPPRIRVLKSTEKRQRLTGLTAGVILFTFSVHFKIDGYLQYSV